MIGTYRIRITPCALADLTAVFDFIRKDSPQNAKGMIRAILDAIDSLEQFPQRFQVAPLQSAKSRNIRSMVVYPYIIRYRVDESQACVHVMHVRHGARKNR